MDQNQSNEEPTVYFSPTPIYKQRWVKIVFFIALSPLLALAFLWIKDQPLFQPKTSSPQVATSSASLNTVQEENLPIALDILKNPMVYEWWGAIEGVLVTWDQQSFTLEKDGKQIRIWLDLTPNTTGTKFFYQEETKLGPKAKDTKIEEIPIGSYLRGDAFIHKADKNKIVGSSFVILKQ